MSCSPPPALPPKKRQSAPSPTRVAVVAPMSRATSGSSLPVGINRQVMASPLCESQGGRAAERSRSSEKCWVLQPCGSQHAPARPRQPRTEECCNGSFSGRNVDVGNHGKELSFFFTLLIYLNNEFLQTSLPWGVAECENQKGRVVLCQIDQGVGRLAEPTWYLYNIL